MTEPAYLNLTLEKSYPDCVTGMLTSQSQRPRTYKLRSLHPMPPKLVERMQKNLSNVPEEALPAVWEHSYTLSGKTSVTDIYEPGVVKSKFRIVVGEQLAISESLLRRRYGPPLKQTSQQ